MSADEKLFKIGMYALFGVLLLTQVLQICYSNQDKKLRNIRKEIEGVQQEIAANQTLFAASVQAENLRNVVTMIVPNAETIGFVKTVSINEIPLRSSGN